MIRRLVLPWILGLVLCVPAIAQPVPYSYPLTRSSTGITARGGYFGLPTFTTALLPVGTEGDMLYNTTTHSLYVRTDSGWVNYAPSPGVTDHSALSNLAYASSGHTGFADSGHTHGSLSNLDLYGTLYVLPQSPDPGLVDISGLTGTHAVYSSTGIDRASAGAETYNIQNSDAGAMTLQVDGSTVWTAGNDGTGSGLDADTVDGSHAASFAASGHNHDLTYLGISAKAADSDLLDGHDTAYFQVAGSYLTSEADGVVGNEVTNATDSTLTRSGSGTGGSPYTLGINLGNANTWAATQTVPRLNVSPSAGNAIGVYSVMAGGGWNYAGDFEATTANPTALNCGVFAAAANSSTSNMAIKIPAGYPNAGTNNYAIKSDSTAMSAFAGNVAITGPDNTTSALSVTSGKTTQTAILAKGIAGQDADILNVTNSADVSLLTAGNTSAVGYYIEIGDSPTLNSITRQQGRWGIYSQAWPRYDFFYNGSGKLKAIRDAEYLWASTNEAASEVYNAGINSPAAGVVKVTDGSTGQGTLWAKEVQVSNGSTSPGTIAIYEDTDDGTNKTTITTTGAITADRTIQTPDHNGIMWVTGERFQRPHLLASTSWAASGKDDGNTNYVIGGSLGPITYREEQTKTTRSWKETVTGLDISADDTVDDEGVEIFMADGVGDTLGDGWIVTGTTGACFELTFTIANVSATDQFLAGWRSCVAFDGANAYANYVEHIALGITATDGSVTASSRVPAIAGGAQQTDDSGTNLTDGTSHTLRVCINASTRVPTAYLDGVAVTLTNCGGARTTATSMAPFVTFMHGAEAADAGIVINRLSIWRQ